MDDEAKKLFEKYLEFELSFNKCQFKEQCQQPDQSYCDECECNNCKEECLWEISDCKIYDI